MCPLFYSCVPISNGGVTSMSQYAQYQDLEYEAAKMDFAIYTGAFSCWDMSKISVQLGKSYFS